MLSFRRSILESRHGYSWEGMLHDLLYQWMACQSWLGLEIWTHCHMFKDQLNLKTNKVQQSPTCTEEDPTEGQPRQSKGITLFYSFVSGKKRQDALTVAHNIKTMMLDLFVISYLNLATFNVFISVVDGCAVQYCSESVCYQCWSLAKAFNVVYNCIIHPSTICPCRMHCWFSEWDL